MKNKTILSIISIFTLFISLVSCDNPSKKYSEGLEFRLSADKSYYTVSIGTCDSTDIVIPGKYKNKPVKEIPSYAFCDSNIKSITIGEGVEIINDNAFNYCYSLKNLSIPNSLVYFGTNDINRLDYTIYNNIKYIGNEKNPYLLAYTPEVNENLDVIFHNDCKFIYYFDLLDFANSIVLPENLHQICNTYDTNVPKKYFSFANEYEDGYYLPSQNNPYLMLIKTKNETSNNESTINTFNFHPDTKYLLPGWNYSNYNYINYEHLTLPEGVTYLDVGILKADNVNFNNNLLVANTCYGGKQYTFPNSVRYINHNMIKSYENELISDAENYNYYSNGYYAGTKKNPYMIFIGPKEGVSEIILHEDTSIINDSAFALNLNIKKVITNKKLQKIGNRAFSGCENLDSIVLYDNLFEIGNEAFKKCGSLTNFKLPENLHTLGYTALYGCDKLESLQANEKLRVLGNANNVSIANNDVLYAFNIMDARLYSQGEQMSGIGIATNNEIENFTLPKNTRYIGIAGLSGYTKIKSIEIPKKVRVLEKFTFYSCTSLEEVKLNSKVISLGSYLLSGCKSLKSFTIDDGITSISDGMFSGCSSLVEINIPNDVKYIGRYAFSGCSSLKTITLPDSLNTIYNYAFEGCSSLENITIPSSVEFIYDSAFEGCSSLTNIINNSQITYIPNCFIKDTSIKEFIINEGVTHIDNLSFANSNIEKIYIPSTVNHIDVGAFDDCPYLKEIVVSEDNPFYDSRDNCNAIIETKTNKLIKASNKTFIPSSVTSIGNKAFAYLDRIFELVIPNNVTSIEDNAFVDCSINKITIPSSITSFGTNIFTMSDLKEVIIELNEYQKDLFSGCNIKKVDILGGEYISEGLFKNSSITQINLPDTVKIIDEKAFMGCDNLTYVKLPSSLEVIGEEAFKGCSLLGRITIPNNVKEIGSETFSNCKSLSNVILSSNITVIEEKLFENCSSLSNIEIPNGVTTIKSNAFYRCGNLKEVVIPSSVTCIEEKAFYKNADGCIIYFEGSKEQWDNINNSCEFDDYQIIYNYVKE